MTGAQPLKLWQPENQISDAAKQLTVHEKPLLRLTLMKSVQVDDWTMFALTKAQCYSSHNVSDEVIFFLMQARWEAYSGMWWCIAAPIGYLQL